MVDPTEYGVEATASGVSIKVHVAPRASANKVAGAHDGALKIALTAPPVEGAANKALVDFISKTLGVPRSRVSIVSGQTSRNKVLRVEGISVEEVLKKLLPCLGA